MEHALDANYVAIAPAVEQGALGDLEELLRVHRARILRFVVFSIKDLDAAESITQDCFLKAYRNRAQFRGDCSVSTWLTRIAYHLICDHTRTDRFKFWKAAHATAVDAGEIAGSLRSEGASPEKQAIARDQVNLLLRLLDDLPPRQRHVFTLHFLNEMTVDEIATSLLMPHSTVKTHLYRATARMRKMLGEKQ